MIKAYASTIAAPLIAAASSQKIFFGQLAVASIQERPLIKNNSTDTQRFTWNQFP